MRMKLSYTVEKAISLLTGKSPMNLVDGDLPEQSLFNWNETIMCVIPATQMKTILTGKYLAMNRDCPCRALDQGHWLQLFLIKHNLIVPFAVQQDQQHSILCADTS